MVNYLTDAIVTDCILYYNWLHMRFVKEYEEALRARQRIEIMMSQMQPHFLYNTLMTIQALCRKDPEKAFEITGRFGIYLRQNIDSLEHMELIPLKIRLKTQMQMMSQRIQLKTRMQMMSQRIQLKMRMHRRIV